MLAWAIGVLTVFKASAFNPSNSWLTFGALLLGTEGFLSTLAIIWTRASGFGSAIERSLRTEVERASGSDLILRGKLMSVVSAWGVALRHTLDGSPFGALALSKCVPLAGCCHELAAVWIISHGPKAPPEH
jgi:hypothetical protein